MRRWKREDVHLRIVSAVEAPPPKPRRSPMAVTMILVMIVFALFALAGAIAVAARHFDEGARPKSRTVGASAPCVCVETDR